MNCAYLYTLSDTDDKETLGKLCGAPAEYSISGNSRCEGHAIAEMKAIHSFDRAKRPPPKQTPGPE